MVSIPKMPEIRVPRMPDPEDPAVIEARRARLRLLGAKGGRESTILTENMMGSHGKVGG